MNWDAIGALAEILGALGVIATLFYLSFQIRQNTKSNLAASTESIARDIQEFSLIIFKDEKANKYFQDYVHKGVNLDEVPEDARFGLHLLFQSAFTLVWRAFDQHKADQASTESWEVIFAILRRTYCSSQTVKDWFETGREIYPTDFVELIDAHWTV